VNIDLLKGRKDSSILRNCTKRELHCKVPLHQAGYYGRWRIQHQLECPYADTSSHFNDQSILTKENQELRAKLSALQDTVTGMAQTQSHMQRNFPHLFSTLNTVDWKLTKEQAALVEAAGGAISHFTETQGAAAASLHRHSHQPLSQPQ
jgi:hypothetical protein